MGLWTRFTYVSRTITPYIYWWAIEWLLLFQWNCSKTISNAFWNVIITIGRSKMRQAWRSYWRSWNRRMSEYDHGISEMSRVCFYINLPEISTYIHRRLTNRYRPYDVDTHGKARPKQNVTEERRERRREREKKNHIKQENISWIFCDKCDRNKRRREWTEKDSLKIKRNEAKRMNDR